MSLPRRKSLNTNLNNTLLVIDIIQELIVSLQLYNVYIRGNRSYSTISQQRAKYETLQGILNKRGYACEIKLEAVKTANGATDSIFTKLRFFHNYFYYGIVKNKKALEALENIRDIIDRPLNFQEDTLTIILDTVSKDELPEKRTAYTVKVEKLDDDGTVKAWAYFEKDTKEEAEKLAVEYDHCNKHYGKAVIYSCQTPEEPDTLCPW